MPPKTLIRALVCACLMITGGPLCATTSSSSASSALAAVAHEILINHPGVRAAQAAVAAARARARAASQPLYNPQLGLEVEEAEESSQALDLSQSIDWADKRGARADVAAFEYVMARMALATTRQELAGELLSALASYHTARALARLGRHRTYLMRRFALVSEQRSEAGDLNRVNLEIARLAFAEAKLRRARAASHVIAAHQHLIAIAGDTRHEWPSLSGVLSATGARAPDFKALLYRLPIVRADRARMNAARSVIELQIRQRRPDPTIVLRGGREEDEALVGLNLSLPLFVRNTFSAEVDAANAELIRAQKRAQHTYQRAGARLEAAFQQYRLARNARADWQASGQQSLTVQVGLLKRLWQAGALSAADFLVQLNQALDTRASAIELHGHAWQTWFEWLAASGQTNAWLGAGRM